MRMWIFLLLELIEATEDAPEEPEVILSVGVAPNEIDKDFTGGQFETVGKGKDDEEDEYGFGGLDEGFDQSEFDNIDDDYDI